MRQIEKAENVNFIFFFASSFEKDNLFAWMIV